MKIVNYCKSVSYAGLQLLKWLIKPDEMVYKAYWEGK